MFGSPVPSSYSLETDFKRNKIKGSLNEWVYPANLKHKSYSILKITSMHTSEI